MEGVTDWVLLWRQLVEERGKGRAAAQESEESGASSQTRDAWRSKARAFHKQVQARWVEPDSSRTAVAAYLAAAPESTVVDIGAGTGAWAIFMARRARHVTAVDPSPTMLEVLRENVKAAGLDNVSIIEGAWPEVEVTEHDVAFCSHALYGVADLAGFVTAMEAAARRRCYLLLRAPAPDGVMAEAAERVWGQPYDSPNFQIAYNALLQMGIFADVQMENDGNWRPWTSASLQEALDEIKQRLNIVESGEYDVFLRELLARRLRPEGDHYVWPPAIQSALVSWDVGEG